MSDAGHMIATGSVIGLMQRAISRPLTVNFQHNRFLVRKHFIYSHTVAIVLINNLQQHLPQ